MALTAIHLSATVYQETRTPREGTMTLSREDRVRDLAQLVGIPIMESEIAEVVDRFDSLIQELDRLTQLDLSDIQPVTIFSEEEPLHGQQ
jgi:hypothetical protein